MAIIQIDVTESLTHEEFNEFGMTLFDFIKLVEEKYSKQHNVPHKKWTNKEIRSKILNGEIAIEDVVINEPNARVAFVGSALFFLYKRSKKKTE